MASQKLRVDEFAMPTENRPPMGPVALTLYTVSGAALGISCVVHCAAHVMRELAESDSVVLSSYEMGELVGGCIGVLIVAGIIVLISWGVSHASRIFGAYVLLVLAALHGLVGLTRLFSALSA